MHSRFEELESLSRVGLELEEGVEQEIARGRLLRALLRQPRMAPRGLAEQVLSVLAVGEGWMDGLSPEQAPRYVESLVTRLRSEQAAIAAALDRGELPPDSWTEDVGALAASLRHASGKAGA
jgi:F-type H+-transporting ATPase subunit alpha